jgi:hypothetical protein
MSNGLLIRAKGVMVMRAQSLEHIRTSIVGTRSPETWAGRADRENALVS